MAKKYTLSYVSMDKKHLGSNPLHHAGLILSEYDEATGRMKVLNAWGLYSNPNRENDLISRFMKNWIGVGFWVTGGYGNIQYEAMADLERGIGLQGHTVEISAEKKDELLKDFRTQLQLQYDALEEAKTKLISAGVNKDLITFLVDRRQEPIDAEKVVSEQRTAIRAELSSLGVKQKDIRILFDTNSTPEQRTQAADQAIFLVYQKAEKEAVINPKTIMDTESIGLPQENTSPRLQSFNFNLFSQNANYCKVYAMRVMEKSGVPDNVVTEIAGHRVFGSAPRYSGGQQPAYLHSEGGVQMLDVRYSKDEFKKREQLEQALYKLGQEITYLRRQTDIDSKLLEEKKGAFVAKQQELIDFLKQSNPERARLVRAWASNRSLATYIGRHPFLPKAAHSHPRRKMPRSPRDRAGTLYWTAPPRTYYDQEGNLTSFGHIDDKAITAINQAAKKLGEVRYILETSEAMAKNPQALAILVAQIEDHQQKLSHFKGLTTLKAESKVKAVETWLAKINAQLHDQHGELTVPVGDKASLSVQLFETDCEKLAVLSDKRHSPRGGMKV